MECLGFEPGTAGCKAQTENPLRYGGPHDRTFLAGKFFFMGICPPGPDIFVSSLLLMLSSNVIDDVVNDHCPLL